MPKPRAELLMLTGLVLAAAVVALVPRPLHAEQIHRYAFGGKNTVLVRGDANVRVEEKEHDISTHAFQSQPTSEHLKLTADGAPGDAAFVHYHYDTPVAPVTAALSAGVWVKATRAGVQLRARVVFPKEPDPARPEAPLTALIVGDTYDKPHQWQPLSLADVPALVGKQLPVLQTKVGRAVNSAGAYIDRLVLNLYTGPGTADVWIDDLSIGPVKAADAAGPGAPGVPAKQARPGEAGPRGRTAEYKLGQLAVDGKPFFFRAVRHTGAPLHVLRQAGFDALWVPPDVKPEVLAEANREGWMVVPGAPPAAAPAFASASDAAAVRATADALAGHYRKFAATDVLFWDLGGGRVAEQVQAVHDARDALRAADPQRPAGADVWDGLHGYSTFLDVIGAHRWPLFTSLELNRYREWLEQRHALVSARPVFWTWVQDHLPDWYVATVLKQKPGDAFADPIGPHPEQVRQLAYIGVACGCRGLGFWSDQYLADSHHGRDRLQGMAILNAELEMLAPVLQTAVQRTRWLPTSEKDVMAALIPTGKGVLLLPIWFGAGGQYVPEQAAAQTLTVTVPLVGEGADPWRITPAGVECLRTSAVKEPGGTKLTIAEFDLVTPIVFTNDQTPEGLVVWWQDYARKYGRVAARWALDLAAEEYEKTFAVNAKLAQMGVTVRGADNLFWQAKKYHDDARRNFSNGLYQKAFADAHRALRPLRVVMRDHWKRATATLDVPSASPYAVSFYSLPKHWELFRELQPLRPAETVLPGGAFEPPGVIPKDGIPVDGYAGWSARYGTLESDGVAVAAGIVPAEGKEFVDKYEPKPKPKESKLFPPSRPIVLPGEDYVPPAPPLGRGVLKLEMRLKPVLRDGQPVEQPTRPLERAYLVVESPAVRLTPGSLVRVSGWMKIPGDLQRTADGALLYDDAGGEPLGVRLVSTEGRWKQFKLYRRVPDSGQMTVAVALTGLGVVYFDDLRIEPLVPRDSNAAPATNTTAGSAPAAQPVQPVQPVRYPRQW